MVSSLVVSRARNIPAATYITRGCCYFCFCDETAVLCENVFFLQVLTFQKIRVGSDDSGFILGT